jgi:hypothetical protein
MTLSILLTTPWDSKAEEAPPRLEVPKVRPHRFSWKDAGTVGIPKDPWHVTAQRLIAGVEGGGSTEDAEVITSPGDERIFAKLHGVIAKDANYDKLAASIAEDDYRGIVDVLKEMATQRPDAMWFVRIWSVEASASD